MTAPTAQTTLAAHASALQTVLSSLGVLTVAQLVDLFNRYSGAAGFVGLLHSAVPEIAGQHAQAAAAVTAQWYDELAPDAQFRATPVVDLAPEQITKTVDWAIHAPGDAPPLDRLAGSAKRMVFDASRDTVVSNANTEGVRWARYASATACAFCRLLAIRGPVYTSKPAAAFKAHDHCRCLAVPERGGAIYHAPPYVQDWNQQYQDARAAGNSGTHDILAHMRANTDAA